MKNEKNIGQPTKRERVSRRRRDVKNAISFSSEGKKFEHIVFITDFSRNEVAQHLAILVRRGGVTQRKDGVYCCDPEDNFSDRIKSLIPPISNSFLGAGYVHVYGVGFIDPHSRYGKRFLDP